MKNFIKKIAVFVLVGFCCPIKTAQDIVALQPAEQIDRCPICLGTDSKLYPLHRAKVDRTPEEPSFLEFLFGSHQAATDPIFHKHSFCQACLKRLLPNHHFQNIPCPLCKERIPFDDLELIRDLLHQQRDLPQQQALNLLQKEERDARNTIWGGAIGCFGAFAFTNTFYPISYLTPCCLYSSVGVCTLGCYVLGQIEGRKSVLEIQEQPQKEE